MTVITQKDADAINVTMFIVQHVQVINNMVNKKKKKKKIFGGLSLIQNYLNKFKSNNC